MGPTVDGRPYQVAGFRQMLENYHTAALRAHKDHAGVDAMIPVPVPPPPVPLQPVPEAPGGAQPGSVRFQEGVDPSKDGA